MVPRLPRLTGTHDIDIAVVAPAAEPARRATRAYLDDVASRYYGRPATDHEIGAALREHPIDDLLAPYGFFLVASTAAGDVCGCVGVARVDDTTGEVRRLHVAARARRRGLGRRLMLEVEDRARVMGLATLRLDTREDLVESQRLYEELGYVASAPHSGGPYADRWYRKSLS